MPCLIVQRTVERYIITLGENFFKGGKMDPRFVFHRRIVIGKDFHTESLCNFNDFAADMSGADNTQCLSVDFHMVYLHAFGKVRMVIPGQHGHLPAHGGTEVHNHHNSGVGNTFGTVGRNIADRNPLFSGCI